MTCGITKLIPRVFAPSWNFKKLKRKPRNIGGLKKRAAKARGNRIDQELKNDVNESDSCIETKLIRNMLDERCLDIDKCQVLVTKKNLKTFLDMVVTHRETRQKFILEIKRGCIYRSCATVDGKLRFQTKDLNDCLLRQHELQVLIGRWMYQHEHDHGVLLLYVNESSVEVIEETHFEAELTPMGKQALLQYALKKQKRKEYSRKNKRQRLNI